MAAPEPPAVAPAGAHLPYLEGAPWDGAGTAMLMAGGLEAFQPAGVGLGCNATLQQLLCATNCRQKILVCVAGLSCSAPRRTICVWRRGAPGGAATAAMAAAACRVHASAARDPASGDASAAGAIMPGCRYVETSVWAVSALASWPGVAVSLQSAHPLPLIPLPDRCLVLPGLALQGAAPRCLAWRAASPLSTSSCLQSAPRWQGQRWQERRYLACWACPACTSWSWARLQVGTAIHCPLAGQCQAACVAGWNWCPALLRH